MPAMWIAGSAAVGAAGNIFSSIFGSSAAKQQANAIRDAANIASKTALELNDRSRADLAPFRNAGATATQQYSDILSGKADINSLLQYSTLFNFAQTYGTRDINRELAARGQWNSGAGLETLAKFNADLTQQIGQSYMGNLFNLSQLGENAAANTASNTTSTANTIAQTQTQAGEARAAAIGQAGQSIANIGPGIAAPFATGLANYGQYTFYKPILDQWTPQNQGATQEALGRSIVGSSLAAFNAS